MADSAAINLQHVARSVGLPLKHVQATVELLDEGNTVPFITRYRKDQTGGLDEEQIRRIQARITQLRLLGERKQTILRSIESQGKLTESLAAEIEAATTTRRLEDLYLPYKPKKQTLATQARARGLENLALEILAGDPACADLDARAADFISEDRKVFTAADALLGAGHILAELLAERADLRQKLREILQRTGKLVSKRIADPAAAEMAKPSADQPAAVEPATSEPGAVSEPAPSPEPQADATERVPPESEGGSVGDGGPRSVVAEEGVELVTPSAETSPIDPVVAETAAPSAQEQPTDSREPATERVPPESASKPPARPRPLDRKAKAQLKKQQARERQLKALADYFDYEEALSKIPPHRILAINRGERSKVLRVRIEADMEAIHQAVEETLVPPEHPHADFLRGCARDALARLVLPSLERDLRRELTERAETHAVEVFARNLRQLLLQPPVHGRRVLAVDPGYRSGCKLVALDQFGNVLDHAVIYLVGKSARRPKAARIVAELVDRYQLKVVALGNGTACRETESFFAELVEGELADRELAYVVVNEAGASVYSTSRLGREEFPHYDATLRGAISIGRRLQDPLSELVKIDPASIGVGLYQHDVRAKHLRDSLDEVVESCVNFVGVNVNTASPALLRYVSGMNQLTARRVYEHRMQHGPFRNRAQLRDVPGLGEATFVQAAGFLKIVGGDQPLDATWIHPESYPAAQSVLAKLNFAADDLADKGKLASLADGLAALDLEAVAAELGVGTMLLTDILADLARPGRDPREDLPAPVFKRGVLKIENLTPGMELAGTVLNVVDFGAFVDIGLHDSGLVHVSQLAARFVRDPHDVVAVGDVVRVWVLEVNKERRRVSLTMIPPGTKKPERPPRPKGGKPQSSAPARDGAKPPAGGRKPRPKGPPHGKGKPPERHGPYQVRSKPKPVVPLTEKMKAGVEPMRTFGDLAQFFQLRKADSASNDPPEPSQEQEKEQKEAN